MTKRIWSLALLVLALMPAELHSQANAPAARLGDQQVCPLVTGLVPHVGGPIAQGSPNVLICAQPAARVTDQCICVGPPSVIVGGSSTVLINGLPAARLGSPTSHGGTVIQGCPTVLIGG